jgi:hypothetical protein
LVALRAKADCVNVHEVPKGFLDRSASNFQSFLKLKGCRNPSSYSCAKDIRRYRRECALVCVEDQSPVARRSGHE